jgi:FkbM family methyltransferase
MKEFFISILKRLNLYAPLVNYKRNLDKKKYKKEEKNNLQKRVAFYKQFLFPGDLVYDVGANIGNRVESFLVLKCNVIAVEPQQDCIDELRRKFGNLIQIAEVGLGESESEKTMYISNANTISSLSEEWIKSVKESRFSQYEWNKKVQIKLTTLDLLIKKYGSPKFCKIDVEGYELEVLKGLTSPIPFISLEYTVPEQLSNLLNCISYCNSLNSHYKYNYSKGENMKFELVDFISFDEFTALIRSNKFIETSFGDIYLKL